MLRPAHSRRRVGRQHLAGDQPVEQHAHGRKLLLHARRRVLLLQAWDVSVLAILGLQFDLSTPHGKMIASSLSAILSAR